MSKLYVKFVKNNKLNTVRIVCAYNVIKNVEGVYSFPPQKSCAYVSGDIVHDDVQSTLERISQRMQADLQVTN